MRLLIRVVSLLSTGVALASLGALSACNSNNACEGVSCNPSVVVTPDSPISAAGKYEVELIADGKTFTCTLKIPSTLPAQCSDDAAYVRQEQGQGIVYLSLDGTYKKLAVKVVHDGATVAEQTFTSLKYVNADFTGVGCNGCPTATQTLNNGKPDASAGGEPDAAGTPAPGAAPDAATAVVTPPDAAAP